MADDETPPVDAPDHAAQIAELEQRLTKAVADRDDAIRRRKDSVSLSSAERQELADLKATQEAAEEARQRQAGEFDTLKAKIEAAKDAADQRAAAAEARFADKVIETAFHGARELFGPAGLTTLTPEFAMPAFKGNVRYIPSENGTPGRLEVLNLKGEPITAGDGESATFAAGMAQLIDQWPSRDSILRAAGKTGSGAGESHDTINVESASRAQLVAAAAAGDPAALKRLQATQPGTQVSGAFWERKAAG
jgi:hypothetical protein